MSQTSAFPRIRLSATARALLDELDASRHEQQVLVMHSSCAAPSLVKLVPARQFRPRSGQAQVTVLSHHPVWADEAELRACPHRSLLIAPVSPRVDSLRLVARRDDPEGERRS